MGLAPKQRARLSIQKEVHSLLWCLSHFPAATEPSMAREKRGQARMVLSRCKLFHVHRLRNSALSFHLGLVMSG